MKLIKYCLILLLVLLSGCATTRLTQSIDGSPLTKISSVDASHLFAVEPIGEKVVLSDKGLQLLELEPLAKKSLSQETPLALAWSHDGSQFAATFPKPDQQTIVTLYSADGVHVHEHVVPFTASQMAWSVDGELLVTGYLLKVYSFGSNLSQSMAVIKGEDVKLVPLTDATLDPSTSKALQPVLAQVLPVLFTPLGDELLYVRLHDPPEFAPYLKVLYKNSQADKARELLKLPLQILSLDWLSRDVAEVITSRGNYELELWPVTAGPDSSLPQYRFQNGRLMQRERVVADWGGDARFQRLREKDFLLATNRSLYLGSGLDPQVSVPAAQNESQLRRWRYQGLITPSEYRALLQEKR